MRDLFELPHLIPAEVKAILDKWTPEMANYDNCWKLMSELEKVGYTCSYGLDAVPYFLRKMYRKPIDFSQELVDKVVAIIREDVESGDVEALEELLKFIPKETLIDFLPDEEWIKYQ